MQKPIVCLKCHSQYQNQPEDTIVHFYTEEFWLSWFSTTCPLCGNNNMYYCGDDYLAPLMQEGCRVITTECGPEELAKGYTKVFNKPPLRWHRLDDHERHILEFFHYLLEVCDIVAETVNTVPDLHLQRSWAA